MNKHTPGPWRWEFNSKHKNMHLVGGVPRFDLTVMDFERWGMGGAVVRFRDLAEDGMNTMCRVCDKQEWIAPHEGRAHHADWCADINHADARLIAAAPELLEFAEEVRRTGDTRLASMAIAIIAKATGEQS